MTDDVTRPTPPGGDPPEPPEDATIAVPGAGASPPAGTSGRVARPASSSTPFSSSTPSLDGGRFGAGTLLADRYRVVGLLGRGGMGEVYRADDLTLGQSVALKFLPDDVAQDLDRRRRFHEEVRMAREIAHPNVCRVYDIGEVDGRTFLTMEYVDGEDLGSLLRRIGRLPSEKAVEIARQLCAGLAALHDRGVLHRDLKPANVMVDGRGRVRLTDFGLAGFGGTIEGAEIRAGTPAYMAPEQLAGEHVDMQSDVYALGLVLYEIYTGKRAFQADTLPELRRLQLDSTPQSPSTILPDIDPAVERVIARCLDRDPAARPASALAVAAALPGGDPLAAALAAGEIPSLQMVAAAGGEGRIRPLVAGLCVAAVVAGIVVSALVVGRTTLISHDPMEKAPAVLRDRAQEILRQVGHESPAVDTGHGFGAHRDVLRHLAREEDTPERWEALRDGRPAGVLYWYRQSPGQLIPGGIRKRLTLEDPPETVSGMAHVLLDTSGRLQKLTIVPPQHEESVGSPDAPDSVLVEAVPDWPGLFAAAGLDFGAFEEAEPEWVPPNWADTRRAWTGSAADDPGRTIRVEAASFRGRPVQFQVLGPWSRPGRMVPDPNSLGERIFEGVFVVAILFMFAAVFWLGIRNLRKGIGDRLGAWRLGSLVFLLASATWMLTANHATSSADEINMMLDSAAGFLFGAALFAAFYLALEPFVRRTWPGRIVSWSRLLTGRFRDPLVGRDVLIGGALFFGYVLIHSGTIVAEHFLELPTRALGTPQWEVLLGTQWAVATAFGLLSTAILNAMVCLLLLVFLRKVLRRQWLACVVYVVLFGLVGAAAGSGGSAPRILSGVTAAVLGGFFVLALIRYGLVPFLVMYFAYQIVTKFPMTLDSGVWYSSTSFLGMGVILAVAVYGLWASAPGWAAERPDRT